MSDPATNDANIPEKRPRQHAAVPLPGKSWEWPRLLTLRPADQSIAAMVLLLTTLGFGGWYIWRATTSPGLIDIDRTEPVVSKLVVNVNTADAAELMLLPSIGKVLASHIVEERLANGLFRNPAQFDNRIDGIGPLTLSKVVPFLEGWTEEPTR